MPALWRECLEGRGEINLSAVPLAANATYLWPDKSIASRFASLFAPRFRSARSAPLARDERPEAFRDDRFRGSVFRLDEFVLDVPALVHALAGPHAGRILKLDAAKAKPGDGGAFVWDLPEARVTLRPRRVVLTVGQGFEELSRWPGLSGFVLYRRPLHMVIVEHDCPLPVFGHCVGRSTTPLLTVTTHPVGKGRYIWYLGGGLAEDGAGRASEDQIRTARDLLAKCIPWLELGRRKWRAARIDRVVVAQPGRDDRPSPFAAVAGKFIVAWPSRLALAPLLARRIIALLPDPTGLPERLDELEIVPLPAIAAAPWARTGQ
jgi:hypothetical protein